jgi:hypothetical protein
MLNHYLRIAFALAALTGCGADSVTSLSAGILNAKPAKGGSKSLIYVGQNDIAAYPANPRRHSVLCVLSNYSANALAADSDGDVIVALGTSITVFKGPEKCGPEAGSFTDGFGTPVDVASSRALTGEVVVGNELDNSGRPGSISVCTLSHGCLRNLTNSNMYFVYGVALANDGNCWASGVNSANNATLTYFRDCKGSGKTATGYNQPGSGALDIDGEGHLVSISSSGPSSSSLYIYEGCDPACKLYAGPLSLEGESVSGHLNEAATMFAATDIQNNTLDIYRYTPTSLQLEYAFGSGSGGFFRQIVYSPRSRE